MQFERGELPDDVYHSGRERRLNRRANSGVDARDGERYRHILSAWLQHGADHMPNDLFAAVAFAMICGCTTLT